MKLEPGRIYTDESLDPILCIGEDKEWKIRPIACFCFKTKEVYHYSEDGKLDDDNDDYFTLKSIHPDFKNVKNFQLKQSTL